MLTGPLDGISRQEAAQSRCTACSSALAIGSGAWRPPARAIAACTGMALLRSGVAAIVSAGYDVFISTVVRQVVTAVRPLQVRCRLPGLRPARRGLSWPRGSAGCVRAVWVWLSGSGPEPLSPFVTVTGSEDAGPPVVPLLCPRPASTSAWRLEPPRGVLKHPLRVSPRISHTALPRRVRRYAVAQSCAAPVP